MSHLYILEINPLSVSLQIFSSICGLSFCLWFPLLCKSFEVYLGLIYFCFYSYYSRKWVKKDLAAFMSNFCLCFPRRALWLCGLKFRCFSRPEFTLCFGVGSVPFAQRHLLWAVFMPLCILAGLLCQR